MTFGTPARLGIAVVVSAALHTAALLPVRVPSGPYIPTPFPASLLNVRLQADSTPLADAMADAAANAPAAATAESTAAIPLRDRLAANPPAQPDADPRTGIAARITTAPARTPSSGEQEAQTRPGIRVALPDEVKVYVRRYDAKAEENPNEVIEVGGGKYFYFNAPQLKQSTQPMADAAPQYPATKLDYPHGAVILLLFIDEYGKLEKTLVECANPAFEESALASIRDMRFTAARDANGPVKSYMKVEFSYGYGNPCGPLPHNLLLNQRPG